VTLSNKKAHGVFTVGNDRGLHTRPSTELVKCAVLFKSEMTLTYRKWEVNAKSLLGILMLAAERGATIEVTAVGEDAEQAVNSLLTLAEKNFNMNY
jgi:phosphocarrier protein HPr